MFKYILNTDVQLDIYICNFHVDVTHVYLWCIIDIFLFLTQQTIEAFLVMHLTWKLLDCLSTFSKYLSK